MKTIVLAASAAFGLCAANAQAASLRVGDLLTIDPGVAVYDANGNSINVSPGSYFALDLDDNSKIRGTEKIPLGPGFQDGIHIGYTTAPGAAHDGCPVAGDTNAITAPWCLGGNTGSDYLVSAARGSTEAGLDFSGWRWNWFWNGKPQGSLGSGAWGTGFADGVGNFTWDGVYGHSYTLRYHATFAGEVDYGSGFGGVKYELFLTGLVYPPVPEAETWALLLAGLGLVGAMTRRRRLATSPPRPHAGE